MTTATVQSLERTSIRSRFLACTAALAVIQVVHLLDVLRYADEATFPGVLADPLAGIGVGLTLIASVMLALRRPSARVWTILAAGGVALGFVLQHAIPVDLGTNNPYWTFAEGNRADWFRWATVIALIGLGAWTAVSAWRTSSAELDDRR